jgi:hypothetical protein
MRGVYIPRESRAATGLSLLREGCAHLAQGAALMAIAAILAGGAVILEAWLRWVSA